MKSKELEYYPAIARWMYKKYKVALCRIDEGKTKKEGISKFCNMDLAGFNIYNLQSYSIEVKTDITDKNVHKQVVINSNWANHPYLLCRGFNNNKIKNYILEQAANFDFGVIIITKEWKDSIEELQIEAEVITKPSKDRDEKSVHLRNYRKKNPTFDQIFEFRDVNDIRGFAHFVIENYYKMCNPKTKQKSIKKQTEYKLEELPYITTSSSLYEKERYAHLQLQNDFFDTTETPIIHDYTWYEDLYRTELRKMGYKNGEPISIIHNLDILFVFCQLKLEPEFNAMQLTYHTWTSEYHDFIKKHKYDTQCIFYNDYNNLISAIGNTDMKFGYVFTNPPFKKNFYLKLLDKLLKNDSIKVVGLIHPPNQFLELKTGTYTKTIQKLKTISKQSYKIDFNLFNGNKIFGIDIVGWCSNTIFQNVGANVPITVRNMHNPQEIETYINFDNINQILLDERNFVSITNKIKKWCTTNNLRKLVDSKIKRHYFIHLSTIRGHAYTTEYRKPFKWDYFTAITPENANNITTDIITTTKTANSFQWISFNTKKEAENTLQYIYCSKLVEFCLMLSKTNSHVDSKVLSWVPSFDFNNEYTDNMLYEMLELSNLEISIIEHIVDTHRKENCTRKKRHTPLHMEQFINTDFLVTDPLDNNQKKSKTRIQDNGEFFTPKAWCKVLIEQCNLTEHGFYEIYSTEKFLDLCCGTGNILLEVMESMLEHGISATDIINRAYGLDIEEDNVIECRQRILKLLGDTKTHKQIVEQNISCGDANAWDFKNWLPLAMSPARESEFISY